MWLFNSANLHMYRIWQGLNTIALVSPEGRLTCWMHVVLWLATRRNFLEVIAKFTCAQWIPQAACYVFLWRSWYVLRHCYMYVVFVMQYCSWSHIRFSGKPGCSLLSECKCKHLCQFTPVYYLLNHMFSMIVAVYAVALGNLICDASKLHQ